MIKLFGVYNTCEYLNFEFKTKNYLEPALKLKTLLESADVVFLLYILSLCSQKFIQTSALNRTVYIYIYTCALEFMLFQFP